MALGCERQCTRATTKIKRRLAEECYLTFKKWHLRGIGAKLGGPLAIKPWDQVTGSSVIAISSCLHLSGRAYELAYLLPVMARKLSHLTASSIFTPSTVIAL